MCRQPQTGPGWRGRRAHLFGGLADQPQAVTVQSDEVWPGYGHDCLLCHVAGMSYGPGRPAGMPALAISGDQLQGRAGGVPPVSLAHEGGPSRGRSGRGRRPYHCGGRPTRRRSVAVSLSRGNGARGTGAPRNRASGCQPSLTWKTSSRPVGMLSVTLGDVGLVDADGVVAVAEPPAEGPLPQRFPDQPDVVGGGRRQLARIQLAVACDLGVDGLVIRITQLPYLGRSAGRVAAHSSCPGMNRSLLPGPAGLILKIRGLCLLLVFSSATASSVT